LGSVDEITGRSAPAEAIPGIGLDCFVCYWHGVFHTFFQRKTHETSDVGSNFNRKKEQRRSEKGAKEVWIEGWQFLSLKSIDKRPEKSESEWMGRAAEGD
jgi:hypothetical protein